MPLPDLPPLPADPVALAHQFERLRAATLALYEAGVWSCDRPVDEASLWTAARDALGLPAGHSTRLLSGA